MKDFIIEKLKKEIEGAKLDISRQAVGKIVEVGDGIAKISGLQNAQAQEMLICETQKGPVTLIAFNLEEDLIGAIVLGDYLAVKEGDTVKRTERVLSVRAGRELLGRVINPLGEPLDGRGPVFAADKQGEWMPIEHKAPGVIARESVNAPIHTGIKAIDSMIPIGRGQRELIIGDRQIGKTALVIDTIINQGKDSEFETPVCIYVAIGQRESKVARIVADLKKHGAMDYTIVVSAPASSPAPFWYLAPYAGAAIGEYFMHQGKDALVVYDDLSKHAWAYRQLSLLLRRPPGREAYPGDIFYLHSRLLERAAKLSASHGGGSLTALPIIETQLGDVSAYIPTNVISITDGQIYLEPEAFNRGQRPAVNVGLSVSRVGSSAQTKAMKKVAGKLRLLLAQFRELQAFVQFASDLDESTKKRITQGKVLTELLKQNEFEPVSFEKIVITIYLGINGFLNEIDVGSLRKYTSDFIDYVEKMHGGILEKIRGTKDIDEETTARLKKAIEEFKLMQNK